MKLKINSKLLGELVAVKSLSTDCSECRKALNLIKKQLDAKQIVVKIGEFNGQPHLISGDINSADILFLSHIDVVSSSGQIFELKISGNLLKGRGVFDMKGPMLASLEAFIKLPDEVRNRILFVITSDEEIGGFHGTSKLTKLFKNIKLAIVPDGGSGENIVVNQRAPLHVKLSHKGVAVHASRPAEGINSVETLAKCCIELSNRIPNCSITVFNGGDAINKVPDSASATLDIRIESEKDSTMIRHLLATISVKYNCLFEEIDNPLFFEADPNNIYISRFKDLVGSSFVTEAGTSDARFLWSDLHIPIIVTSADGGGAHSDAEWVDAESLNKLATNIYNFVINL
ncbi:M20/M25/M40 family metallo-hydrolase [Candidatus Shapirobacteria bacterium]|nr:M20/M25/M40 family metallo-hydrolase [Candidatus Shapirobacteria bacterium]